MVPSVTDRVAKNELTRFMTQNNMSPLTPAQMAAATEILGCDTIYKIAAYGTGKSYLFQTLERFLNEKGSYVRHLQVIATGTAL